MTIPKIAPYSITQSTIEYNNRSNWQIDPTKAVLLVHDMQDYFLNFFDSNQEPISEILQNIKKITSFCRKENIPVFYSAQPPDQNYQDRQLLNDFWGPGPLTSKDSTKIFSAIEPEPEDHHITKWRYSAFRKTNFKEILNSTQKTQLIICGIYGHIGILMTACDAFMEDIQPFVISDAIADFGLQEHLMALNYISQRCGQIVTTEQVLAGVNKKESFNISQMRSDISKILELSTDQILDDSDLSLLGMDSMRLMTLIEQWQSQGVNLDFIQLTQEMTLTSWWTVASSELQ